MQLSELVVPAYAQMLGNLAGQLDKADAHIREQGSSFEALLGRRLASDMFPLEAQIRFCCLQAGEVVHRLLASTPPQVAEIGSLAQAHERIEEARGWLAGADRERLDAASDRPLELALANGITFDMTGGSYVRDWAVPQFHFHLVTAYAIMRHAGVRLGKPDYVPHMLAYLRGGDAP